MQLSPYKGYKTARWNYNLYSSRKVGGIWYIKGVTTCIYFAAMCIYYPGGSISGIYQSACHLYLTVTCSDITDSRRISTVICWICSLFSHWVVFNWISNCHHFADDILFEALTQKLLPKVKSKCVIIDSNHCLDCCCIYASLILDKYICWMTLSFAHIMRRH